MQETPNRRLEFAAYCAIIVLCAVASTALIKKFILTPSVATLQRPTINGTKLSFNHDWTRSNKTLLLVLSEACRFCDESAPFYRHLTNQFSDRQKLQFVAIFPQPLESASKHLSNLGVPIAEVRQVTPSSLGVTGTPTLILVDSAGKVIDSWVGKLSSDCFRGYYDFV